MQVKSLVYRFRSSTLIRSFGVQKGVPANPSCIARSLSHSPPCVCNIRFSLGIPTIAHAW